jgi:hypothetical protein
MLSMAQTNQDEVDIDLTPQELQVLSELDRWVLVSNQNTWDKSNFLWLKHV